MSYRFVVIPEQGECYFYSGDGPTLPALQLLVDGLIDVIDIGGADMVVNDEGRFTKPLNLGASLMAQRPVYGPAVLTGRTASGETVSCPEGHLTDLVGHAFSDEEAVDLMVEAASLRAMAMTVREAAKISGQDPIDLIRNYWQTGKVEHRVPADSPRMAGYL